MEESVHLCTFPEENLGLIDSTLEAAVGKMEQVVLLGRQKRVQEGVKVKTPLKTLKVIHQDASLLTEMKKLEEYIKIELNVKEVVYMTNEADFVTLSAKPNSPVLGKKLGKDFANFRPLIEKLSSVEVQRIEDGGTVTLNGIVFNSEEILVFRTAKAGTQAVTNRFVTIDLDCTLDQGLIEEGLAREMVSRIQQARKSSGLKVDDRIEVKFLSDSTRLQEIFNKFKAYICDETLITAYTFQPEVKGENFILGLPISEETLQIEDRFGMLVMSKVSK